MLSRKPLSLIVAATLNGEIGYKNTIPWKLPGDLGRFRRITTAAGTVIMGRHTFESLPTRGLVGRSLIVVSRSYKARFGPSLDSSFDIRTADRLYEALELAQTLPGPGVCVAGGADLYETAMRYGDVKLHLTQVMQSSPNGYDTKIKDFGRLLGYATQLEDPDAENSRVQLPDGSVSHYYKTFWIPRL